MPGVLHVVQSGDRGGAQRHVRDLLQGLPGWAAGLAVGSGGWLAEEARALGVPVVRIPLRRALDPMGLLGAGRALARAAASLRPAALHAHGVLALGACLAARLPLPLVYTGHGLQWRDPSLPRAVAAASWALHRAAAGRLCAFVAVSDEEAEAARAVGVPAARIHAIPNGVAPRREDGPPPAANAVGVAARLVPGKGLDDVFAAVARVPAARLLLAGDGPAAGELLARGRTLLGERLAWLGWQDDLGGFYDRVGVFATLSRKEGLPYGVLDAMAHGRPVVATDIPGHRQLVAEGASGFLVPVGDVAAAADRLAGLLCDPDLRRRMGRAALERVRAAFALEAMWRRHEALYAEVAVAGTSR
jgi:glycosyltransferase involved in cell wall biosynthesis